ncbi:MAG: DUF493 domain-containing protein [Legionellaceae bacterium]|nr:DUF493 domain-containing protein [Legionellaceae bacterium]
MAHQGILQFPTEFPFKVFGPNDDDFIADIIRLTQLHFSDFNPKNALRCQKSSKRNFVAITLLLYVESQQQLDALYLAVHQHPATKMVL